jgi:hypothetical protein
VSCGLLRGSPKSGQDLVKSLLRRNLGTQRDDCKLLNLNAEGGTRTRTALASQRILSIRTNGSVEFSFVPISSISFYLALYHIP